MNTSINENGKKPIQIGINTLTFSDIAENINTGIKKIKTIGPTKACIKEKSADIEPSLEPKKE